MEDINEINEEVFEGYDVEELKEELNPELIKNIKIKNPAMTNENNRGKKKINFLELEDDLIPEENKNECGRYLEEQNISVPYDPQEFSQSHLSLILSPNFRELELLIRGLEYVKRYNPITKKEEIILRQKKDHYLNEYGINEILTQLKIYTSPEIKLGRKTIKNYYLSITQVSRTINRLIYKNLKRFGMDTQQKQRHAKPLALAIIEILDASFSRSIEGKENILSRPSDFKVEGNMDLINDPSKMFKFNQENLKN
jgi:hypothetical protein